MKKIHLLSLVFILMTVLPGCWLRVYSYPFAQSQENVVSVEICRYDDETKETTPIITLDENASKSILTDITELQCKRHFGDYSRELGKVVIYVTYRDGTAEILGPWNTCKVDTNGKQWVTAYWFDEAEFRELLLNYVDASLVPELDEYTRATTT